MKSTFYVGQRVRLIRTLEGKNVGKHATITGPLNLVDNYLTVRPYFGHDIEIDGYGSRNPDGTVICCPVDWMEPIYDGDQKTSWSECAWQPLKEPVMT